MIKFNVSDIAVISVCSCVAICFICWLIIRMMK